MGVRYVPFVVDAEGNVSVREMPHVSEVGGEEAWAFNFKDMVDGWSTFRGEEARAAANLRTRGFQNYDSFDKKMEQEYLDERAIARQLQMQLNSIFTGAYASLIQGAIERSGTTQGALANQTLFDPQKIAETVSEAGMAGAGQTNQAVYAAESVKALEKLTSAFGVIETKLADLAARIGQLE